jgi:hypothetical protein
MPISSARAANHRVRTAATAEYSLISGIVCRPRPWPRAVSRSAKTARWQGASSSPASFSRAYCAARSGSCPASASALQVSKLRRTAARRSGSSTRINRQGWLSPVPAAGRARSLRELAERDGITRRYVRRLVDLAWSADRPAVLADGTGLPDDSNPDLAALGPLIEDDLFHDEPKDLLAIDHARRIPQFGKILKALSEIC